MNEKKSWNNLQILTKNEIIEFLKNEYFMNPPSKDKVRYTKWYATAQKLQKEMDDHLNDDTGSVLAKKIDNLAREFNSEKDSEKKWKIFEKRSKLLKKFKRYKDKWSAINKKQEKNDKFYETIRD